MVVGKGLIGEAIKPAGPCVAFDLFVETSSLKGLEPSSKLGKLIRWQL